MLLAFDDAKLLRRQPEAGAISAVNGFHSFLRKDRCKLSESVAAYFKKAFNS